MYSRRPRVPDKGTILVAIILQSIKTQDFDPLCGGLRSMWGRFRAGPMPFLVIHVISVSIRPFRSLGYVTLSWLSNLSQTRK